MDRELFCRDEIWFMERNVDSMVQIPFFKQFEFRKGI